MAVSDTLCVEEGLGLAWQEFAFSDALGVALLGFFLSVFLAPLLLRRYQRKVEMLMQGTSEAQQDDKPPDSADHKQDRTSSADDLVGDARTSSDALLRGIDQQSARASSALKSAATVFGVIAWVTLVGASAFYQAFDRSDFLAWVWESLHYLVIVTVAIVPLIVIETPVRGQKVWLFGAIATLIALITIELLMDTSMSIEERIGLSTVGALMLGVIYVAIIGRRLRNAVPLMTLWLMALLLPIFPVASFFTVIETCESDNIAILGAFAGLGLLWLFARWGFRLTAKVAVAYERQKFSDAQFRITLWSIVFALLLVMEATPDDDDVIMSFWGLGIVVAYWAGAVVYRRGLQAMSAWPHPQAMLMLRVFSNEKGVQNLLDDVSGRWSFVGPIYLVGGPDLAKAYLEPHELLLFLQRRLKNLFVLSRADLNDRLQKLELRADPDTRYRVNEFFCHDDTWKPTVIALLDRVQVILLDLRGFVNEDSGTAYELDLLARTGMLRRTVFLQDEFTSEKIVAKIIDEHYDGTIGEKQIVRVDRNTTVDAVVQRLCHTELL
ncbi:MAG: hypothetical protein AAF265_10625 [Pseudomonadota bacterium]